MLRRLCFIPKAWNQSNFKIILAGTQGGQNVLNGLSGRGAADHFPALKFGSSSPKEDDTG
jgi:hypothetical protein